MKRDPRKTVDIGKNLALVTQMGIMILAPVGLCMFAANALIEKYGLGDWVMIIAILLGISIFFNSKTVQFLMFFELETVSL